MNVVIDKNLIKRVMKITGAKTIREAVDIALKRVVKNASLISQIQKK